KRFLRSSSRDSPTRDTSCRKEVEVPSLSYAFNLHRVAAMAGAPDVNEGSFRLLQEPFNHSFRSFSVRHLGGNNSVLQIVGAKDAARSKLQRILVRLGVAFEGFRVDEN